MKLSQFITPFLEYGDFISNGKIFLHKNWNETKKVIGRYGVTQAPPAIQKVFQGVLSAPLLSAVFLEKEGEFLVFHEVSNPFETQVYLWDGYAPAQSYIRKGTYIPFIFSYNGANLVAFRHKNKKYQPWCIAAVEVRPDEEK